MRTYTVMLKEPCGAGLDFNPCQSTQLYVCVGDGRDHAWCSNCGAKKTVPERFSRLRDQLLAFGRVSMGLKVPRGHPLPGSSSDYSGPPEADATGEP